MKISEAIALLKSYEEVIGDKNIYLTRENFHGQLTTTSLEERHFGAIDIYEDKLGEQQSLTINAEL